MSLQMVAFGNTPSGRFQEPGLLSGLDSFLDHWHNFVHLPWILVPTLTFIIALLNIGGGAIPFIKMLLSKQRDKGTDRGFVPQVIKRLFLTQMLLNILSVVFGTSMLVKNLIPGPVIGIVLTANGSVLLYLLTLLFKIDEMKMGAE
jgi:hypothetical protein